MAYHVARLQPLSSCIYLQEQRALFTERQRIADERRAARQQRATGVTTSSGVGTYASCAHSSSTTST